MDAGPLYAYGDADDHQHGASPSLSQQHLGVLIISTLVVTEVVCLLGTLTLPQRLMGPR